MFPGKSAVPRTGAKRIAVVINPYFHYAREVLRGIFTAAQGSTGLEFGHFHAEGDFLPAVKAWNPDGLIVFQMDRRYAKLRVPIVCVGMVLSTMPTHRVRVDDPGVGKMAAEYFLNRSYRHFGFVDYPVGTFSQRRWSGFDRTIRAAGGCSAHRLLPIGTLDVGWPRYWQRIEPAVARWLRSLPRPLALLGANDDIASHIIALCRREGIQVPEEISILGIDDDELSCMSALMPLSSVQLPLLQIGAEALHIVRRQIDAPTRAWEDKQFPPTGVITRHSSDLTAIGDPDIAAATEFIRRNAENSISVADLLRIVPISRRALEQRFAQIVGRSPHQEIIRVRLELVRHRLLTTDMKLQQIANRCGFIDLGNFTRAFRAYTGYTPAAYRSAFRQNGSAVR